MTSSQENVLLQEQVSFDVKFTQFDGFKNLQLTTDKSSTVEEVKCQIELASGIPAELLELYHDGKIINGRVLSFLQTSDVLTKENIIVKLSPEWEHFIKTCTKSANYHLVRRRSRVKMQVLTQEERIFVASFVAARHSNKSLLFGILPCNKSIAKTTKLSKRNILHAAVYGGDKNCIVSILMHGGGRLIDKKDVNGETPLSMGRNMKDIADMLNAYYMMTKQNIVTQDEQNLTDQSDERFNDTTDEESSDEESKDENSDEGTNHNDGITDEQTNQDEEIPHLLNQSNDFEEMLSSGPSCDVTVISSSGHSHELSRPQDMGNDNQRNEKDARISSFSGRADIASNNAFHVYAAGCQTSNTEVTNFPHLKPTINCNMISNNNDIQLRRRRKIGLPSFPVSKCVSRVQSLAVNETTNDVTALTFKDLLAPKPPRSPAPETRRVTNSKYLDITDDRLNSASRQRSMSTPHPPDPRLLNRERERTRVLSESSKEENVPRQITFQQWLMNKKEQKRRTSLSIPKEKERRLSLGNSVNVSPKPDRKFSIQATSVTHGTATICERSSEAFKTWLHKKDEEALERELKLLNKVIYGSSERKRDDILAQLKTNKRRSSKAEKYWRF